MYTKINEKDSAMKLGAIYSKEKTTFTLFSPVADSVFVIFYDKGNDSAEKGRLEMMRTEGELRSIFSATAEGNLDGVYYTYEVHTSDGTFSSHDPYARACGVNGHRSMVIDLSKTDPDGFADEDRPKLADPMSMLSLRCLSRMCLPVHLLIPGIRVSLRHLLRIRLFRTSRIWE